METKAASNSLVQEIAPQSEAPKHVPTDDLIEWNNRRKAVQFKASHALLILFFLWLL